ncbi:hypothetical protein, partial [Snodgrassella sp. CFCC 13594]|uniref:hypothetical protein n=1 Tax=Snodgrassella sp. CFCC 13594 TaxID=1775559 RepID=UPI000AA70D18
IDTSAGTVTNGINNYGILNGQVLLGSNTLNLLSSAEAVATQPQVNGDITGAADSIVNIGSDSDATVFTSNGNTTVGNIDVASGSTLALASGADWAATSDTAGNINNNGTIRLADGTAASTATIGASGAVINNGSIDLTTFNDAGDTLSVSGNY